MDRCWEVIDKQTEEALKSDGFATIERSLLESIVTRDSLTIEEIELFTAVDLWATKECERQGLVVDGVLKRRVLGETLVKALRFPIMKQKDFASVVLDSKILTPDEIVTIIKCLNSVSTSPAGFPETRRPGFKVNTHRCCTYDLSSNNFFGGYSSRTTCILNFSVDKDIKLHGVCLLGQEQSRVSIDLATKDTNKKRVMVSRRGNFSSSSLRCETGPYHGFEVIFNRGVVLVKNTGYRIQAEVTGSGTTRPSGRFLHQVVCSGVAFAFDCNMCGRLLYCLNHDQVQFPELLFTL